MAATRSGGEGRPPRDGARAGFTDWSVLAVALEYETVAGVFSGPGDGLRACPK
jgi:hypothetical protein